MGIKEAYKNIDSMRILLDATSKDTINLDALLMQLYATALGQALLIIKAECPEVSE